jgi:hypothetical protein
VITARAGLFAELHVCRETIFWGFNLTTCFLSVTVFILKKSFRLYSLSSDLGNLGCGNTDGEIADNPNGLKALGLSSLQPVSMPESIMVFGHIYL